MKIERILIHPYHFLCIIIIITITINFSLFIIIIIIICLLFITYILLFAIPIVIRFVGGFKKKLSSSLRRVCENDFKPPEDINDVKPTVGHTVTHFKSKEKKDVQFGAWDLSGKEMYVLRIVTNERKFFIYYNRKLISNKFIYSNYSYDTVITTIQKKGIDLYGSITTRAQMHWYSW